MRKILLIFLFWALPSLAQTNSARMISGVRYVPTCPYQFANTDVTKLVTFTSPVPCAATLPAATAPGFQSGSIFSVANNGVGFVTITPISGTIFGKPSLQLAPGQGVDIYSDGSNYGLQPGAGTGSGGGSSFPVSTAVAVNAGGSITVNSGGSIGTTGSGNIAATSALTSGTAANLANCSPSTAGDLCYWNGAVWTRLPGNGSGVTFLSETAAGVPSWGNPPGGGTVNNGTAGQFTFYPSAGNVVGPNTHLDDSATTANTISANENIAAPNFVGNGTGASAIGLAQGTDNCAAIQAAPPLNVGNSYCLGAPVSITTTYAEYVPATPSTGFRFGTYAAPFITDSIVPSTGSGSVVLASGETGSGNAVLSTSPTLITPALGTPSALILTNATGTPSSITLTNATGLPCAALPALVGDTTSSAGSCTTATAKINGAAVPTSATLLGSNAGNQLVGAVTTGSGTTAVLATSPTLTTPNITTIKDGNGNPFLTSSATASAVDSITVTNAATANPATVTLSATGTDTNINVNIVSKGSGGVQCNGASCGTGAASITSSGMAWWWGGYTTEPALSTGMAVGANNEVRVCGFILPYVSKTTTVYYDIGAQGTGNFDIGIYNSAGSLVMHIGATAVPATGVHSATVVSAPITLNPGFYYTAFTFSSSATNTIFDFSPNSPGSFNPSAPVACGVAANAASGGALPATMGAITANGAVAIVGVKATP